MNDSVRTSGKWARGGVHYVLGLQCDLHFVAGVALSTAALSVLAGYWPNIKVGLVLLAVAAVVWIGWAFWCVVRHVCGRRVEHTVHRTIADGVETAADVYLTLTDPDAVYCMDPVRSRWPGVVVTALGAVGLAVIGLVMTDLLTSLGPESWAEKWQNAISQPAFRAWLIFLVLTAIELLVGQLSSRVQRLVRSANHGPRFADVRAESVLSR